MTYLSDFMGRLYEEPDNAQCGYRYTSSNFVVLHVTSVPQDDETAIRYINEVNSWFLKTEVMLLEKRDAGQQTWRLIHRVEEATGYLPVLFDNPQGSLSASEPSDNQGEVYPVTPPPPVIIPPAVPRPSDS